MSILGIIWGFVRGLLAGRAWLVAENLALRQQVAILKHSTPRPKLRPRDRVFWVWLARLWAEWRSVLLIVQPETVIQWHRQGFRLYWRWRAQAGPVGRPRVEREIRDLIRRMARENPLWGARRIAAEQAAKKGPSAALARSGARCDVPGVRLTRPFARRLACGPFLSSLPKRVLQRPAAPYDRAPRFLLHNRDAVFGGTFRRRVRALGITEVRIAPYAPWQNPYVERLIGSIRRECLDHAIVLGEGHLRRILTAYLGYYHEVRPHLALARNAPVLRAVECPSGGRVVAVPLVGGLHHRYARAA